MIRKTLICGFAVLGVAALAATAVEAKSLDDILSDGRIRIGINPNFPNMSVRNAAGEWEGFDIDVGNAIAEALGVEVEWVPTETPQRVPFLVSDRIDISLGALTRNAERAKLIDYTVPLHTEVLAVLATNKIEGDSWQDFNKEDRIRFGCGQSDEVAGWDRQSKDALADAVEVDGYSRRRFFLIGLRARLRSRRCRIGFWITFGGLGARCFTLLFVPYFLFIAFGCER